MRNFYLSIVRKRDHLLFILLATFSFNLLLNNDSPNSLLVRAKFLDSFSLISSPTMWLKTIMQLEEETQLLREKNLQLALQSDQMINCSTCGTYVHQSIVIKKHGKKFCSENCSNS